MIRPLQYLMFGLAFLSSLGACGHIKMVPDNATAFQEGLRCNMTQLEVEDLAKQNDLEANDLDAMACRAMSDQRRRCETGTGRAVYTLLFDGNDRLVSIQPGYVYDLTYLTYDPTIELCAQ